MIAAELVARKRHHPSDFSAVQDDVVASRLGCGHMVEREQDPALLMLDSALCGRYDLMALADMTGMALVAAGAKPAGTAGGSVQLLYGEGGKWCSKCGEHSSCYLDPTWPGPLPVYLDQNAEKKKAILKGRTDNAKGASPPVTCQVLKRPTPEALEAFKKRRAAGRGRGRGARAGGAAAEGAPEAAGEKLGGGMALDFYAGLRDITDVELCAATVDAGIFEDADEECLECEEQLDEGCDDQDLLAAMMMGEDESDELLQWFVVRSRAGEFSLQAALELQNVETADSLRARGFHRFGVIPRERCRPPVVSYDTIDSHWAPDPRGRIQAKMPWPRYRLTPIQLKRAA